VSIPEAEQRRLFARSGNRCAFPDCRRVLTAEGSPPDRLVVLGEVAHIVAERPGGPRGDFPLPLAERNRAENLILLCNNHHQLIDSQPQTYTVERLRAMKEAHEQWVEKTLAVGKEGSGHAAQPPRVAEVVHSTLVPVERMPSYVYGAPCDLDERDVQGLLGLLRDGEMAPYIVRGKMLYAFQDLAERGNPFEPVMVGQPVDRFGVEEWWTDPDRLGWFIQLLNRTLNKLTGRRGLQLDREHRRYYFAPAEPGIPFAVVYKPLNRRRAPRAAVWQPKKKSTGEVRPYWFHRAVALRFLRTGVRSWALSIRPELRITTDGVHPPPSEMIGGKVTRKKSRTFNYNLLAEVQFWRDYLSESQPRILLPFGHARQTIVVPTTLMRGDVTWPGIPKEHAKPFKNVEYVDDLFSWAEFRSLEEGLEEADEVEWLEEGEGDDEPN
jgi:hypothetical protein